MIKDNEIEKKLEDAFTSSKDDPSKKEEEIKASLEIDELLKETISEFGLALEKKKSPVYDHDQPKKLSQLEKKDEKETKIPKYGPLSEYVKETTKTPPLRVVKEYIKKVKIPAPKIVIPLVALGLIAGSGSFYFSKPRKTNLSPKEKVELKTLNLKQKLDQLPLAVPPAQNSLNEEKDSTATESLQKETTGKKHPEIIPEKSTPIEKKADSKVQSETSPSPLTPQASLPEQSSTPELPPEFTEPYLSTAAPLLELQNTLPAEKTTTKTALKKQLNPTEEQNLPKELKWAFQPTATRPTPKKEPPKEEIKTGDLVPLQMIDILPRVIRKVQPEYPSLALSRGIEGTVIVNALISENGDVIKTAVIKGIKSPFGLNKASEQAVKQWKFKPALKNGTRVKVWKPIAIAFKKKLNS